MSPAHRAALRFLRGGLVAIVSLLVPSQLGGLSRAAPGLAPLVAAARVLVPALGFAAAGVMGATALKHGRRGLGAFGAGLFATGLVLALTAPLLQNLTGFENGATVAAFAAGSTGAAFALGGLAAGAVVARRRALTLGAGFGAGGVVGGLVTVTPSLLAASIAGWPPDAQLFVRVFCSLAGLLAPFAIGGAVAGRILEDAGERRTDD